MPFSVAISTSYLPDSFSRIPHVLNQKGKELIEKFPTAYKAHKIALTVLTGLSLCAGVAALSVGIAFGPGTFVVGLNVFLVSLAVAGIFVLMNLKITDYNDPAICNALRRDAKNSTFDQLRNRYGLKTMLKYEIPAAADWKNMLSQKLQSLPFLEASNFVKNLKRAMDLYVPAEGALFSCLNNPIDWKALWRKEVEGMECCKILERYSLEFLEKCPEFDAQEMTFLHEARHKKIVAWTEYKDSVKGLAESFKVQIRPLHTDLEEALSRADQAYMVNWDAARLTLIEQEYAEEVRVIFNQRDIILADLTSNVKKADVCLATRGISAQVRTELLASKSYFLAKKAEAMKNAIERKRAAFAKYAEKRNVCAREIQLAGITRQEEYNRAQAHFTSQSTVIAQRRDNQLEILKRNYTNVKQTLDLSYREFIAR